MSLNPNHLTVHIMGTEREVVRDIASRQRHGINKYGTTVAENPLPLRAWLQHAYEECLDQAIYLKRAIEEIDKPKSETIIPEPNQRYLISYWAIGSSCRTYRVMRWKNEMWQDNHFQAGDTVDPLNGVIAQNNLKEPVKIIQHFPWE